MRVAHYYNGHKVARIVEFKGRRRACEVYFVDESIKPEKWARRDDVDTIPARCAILPDSKDGMLYQPCVLNPHQIWDQLFNYLYKALKPERKALLKLDNMVLNASKKIQDEYVLQGIRW